LAMVGDRGEAVIEAIEFFPVQIEPEFLRALSERVPAAVLTEHQFAFRDAHGARVDNFVSALFLEVSVLVNPGLMSERVTSHDSFVRLWAERDQRTEQFARRVEMLRLDGGAIGVG